tara:strand:- start:2451 stop:4127 length:1677 start_codon:yes stop_codon:yes gene_type:complete
MIVKEVKFKKEARNEIVEGVSILSQAVKSTLGPSGRTVLIESERHIGGMTSTKDGVTVANSINLEKPFQDIAIRALKEAAKKTAIIAGDGTSTAIVLAEAIIKETLMRTHEGDNMTEITRNISNMTNEVIKKLDDKSIKVIGKMLNHVATISANNDLEIGDMIAKAYEDVGPEGVVLVKDGKNYDTICEVSAGIRFDRGYSSAFQITNEKGQTSELDNPYILITDRKIESLMDIAPLMQEVIGTGRPVLLIAELGKDASDTFTYNIVKNGWKAANVFPPGFGYRQEELLKDLAAATGATFISDKMGSEWSLMSLSDLGEADKAVIDRESTTIIKETNTEGMETRLNDMRVQLENARTEEEISVMSKRIANLCGKVATITVGGTTPMEQKERKDRVDDAVLATKAALEEGVLAGGGIALLEESLISVDYTDRETIVAADILSAALQAPFNQILINADIDPYEIIDNFEIGENNGFNSKSRTYGNMIEMGVIDPAKVSKTALKNATAVAITLLMTDTMITNVREQRVVEDSSPIGSVTNNYYSENETPSVSILWGLIKIK